MDVFSRRDKLKVLVLLQTRGNHDDDGSFLGHAQSALLISSLGLTVAREVAPS